MNEIFQKFISFHIIIIELLGNFIIIIINVVTNNNNNLYFKSFEYKFQV